MVRYPKRSLSTAMWVAPDDALVTAVEASGPSVIWSAPVVVSHPMRSPSIAKEATAVVMPGTGDDGDTDGAECRS